MKPLIRRAFDEAAGPAHEACPACQGPYRGRNELPPVLVLEGQEGPACPDCGKRTQKDGRTAVALGAASPPVIRLVERAAPPPVPEAREEGVGS